MADKKVAESKPQTIVYSIAALIYFDSIKPAARKEAIPFEKLTEAEQQPYMSSAVKFLGYLDKINLRACPKVDREQQIISENQHLETLADMIEEFVKGLKTTKPGLFPSMELAARILKGPEKAQAV